jgi:hypothetical protein
VGANVGGLTAESYRTPTGKVNDTQQAKENDTKNDVNGCQSNPHVGVPMWVYLWGRRRVSLRCLKYP